MGRMKYGYGRTSNDDQTTALQLAALKRARCSHIYENKGLTGTHLDLDLDAAGIEQLVEARKPKTVRTKK